VTAPAPSAPGGRVARNRARRSAEFLDVALRIVAEEGLDALTMARLADEVDTAIGAVYRYFPSKGDLIAAIQADAIDQLQRSHDASVAPVVAALGATPRSEPEAFVRLVVVGRWFCAAAAAYPQQVRLLQLVSSREASSLTAEAATALLPPTLALVESIQAAIDGAAAAGTIDGGDSLARAILWLTAFGGVFVADDLEPYLPDVLGGGRLVRRLNADLLVGWGASRAAVERIEAAIDELGGTPPLVDPFG
jgi:AcrR family transcriptional regulator